MKNRNLQLLILFLSLASTAWAQTLTQTIRGKVVDMETQIPIDYATVAISDVQPQLSATTDAEGNFKIEKVPVGRHTIAATLMGYQSASIPEIMLTSGKELVMTIPLKQQAVEMKEVVVKGFSRKDQPLNSMAGVSARSFSVEETRRYAGGMDDPARMASAFAGVTVGNIQDNAIIIRGNSPKGVSWRLEGVDIPNPNHFAGGNVAGGGAVTLFSSQMLDNSDFYTGAFPAEYGNALAGVFDMKLRSGNNEKYEHTFQAGMMGLDFASEGPIGKKGGASYLVNYRYSTLGLISALKLVDTEEDIRYQDLSFKLNFPTRKAGTFSVWGIGGYDSDAQKAKKDSLDWEYGDDRTDFRWNLGMGVAGLSHKMAFNKKFLLSTTLSGSGVSNKFTLDRLDDNLQLKPYRDYQDKSSKLTLSTTANYKLNAKFAIRTGVVLNSLNYNVLWNNVLNNQYDNYQNIADESGNSGYYQAFVAAKYDLTKNITLTAGLHGMYLDITQAASIDPRANLRIALNERNAISFGYGKHSQMEDLRIYFIKQNINGQDVYLNKDLKLSQAQHFVMSYDWLITDKLRLKVEPYYQYLYDMPGKKGSSYSMINFKQDWELNEKLENNSIGENYGVDVTLERFLKNNYYYLITGSLFESKYRGDDGVWRDTRFNRNYTFNALFGKEFYTAKKNVWGVNLRANFLGGERKTPVLVAKTLAEKSVDYDETQVFSTQADPDLFFDLTLTYRINKPKYSSTIALQFKNVLGTESNREPKYNFRTRSIEETGMRIMFPVLSYKVDF